MDEIWREVANLIKGGMWYEAIKVVQGYGLPTTNVLAVAQELKITIPEGVTVVIQSDQNIDKEITSLQISLTGAKDFRELLAQIKEQIPAQDRKFDPFYKLWVITNPQKYLHIPVVRARYADIAAQMELPLE